MKIGKALVTLALLQNSLASANSEVETKLAFLCQAKDDPAFQVSLSLGESSSGEKPPFYFLSDHYHSDVIVSAPGLYLPFENVETKITHFTTRAGYATHYESTLGEDAGLYISKNIYGLGLPSEETFSIYGSLKLEGTVTALHCKLASE